MLILSFLMILFVGLSTINLSSNIVLDVSERLSENNFNVVYNSLDSYFNSVEKNSTLLLRMSGLRRIIQEKDYDYSARKLDVLQLDASIREITSLASSNDKITFNTISIFCKNGFSYNYFLGSSFPYYNYESCIDYYIENNYISTGYKSSTWCDLVKTYNEVGQTSYSFINLRMLYDPASLEEIGVMITGIDEKDMSRIYSEFSEKAYIIHSNGKIISNNEKSLLGTSLVDIVPYKNIRESNKSMDTLNIKVGKKSQLVTYKKLASNSTYFVVPFDYYSGSELLQTKSFNLNMLFLILIAIVTSIVFALIMSKLLSGSVLSLKNTVKAVYKGNLNARVESGNKDEVSYLGEAFNEMLDEINSLFIQQKEQERMNKTLELKLMQSQINPHLLYNTLDSALWALENKNLSQTKKLILSLSSFFKITLSGGNDLIPITKELELVSNYIDIQNVARGKKIALNIQTDLAKLDFKVIKLTLQPIVENAILHGFSGYRDNGIITITINTVDINTTASKTETIQIVLEDNGIGIPENELLKIADALETYPPVGEITHFGLYNVQRRIKNLFGNEYGIRIESEVGEYTRITMCIPAIRL